MACVAGGRPRRPWHVEGAQQPQRQVPAKKAGGGGGASGAGGGGTAAGNGGSSPSKKDLVGGVVLGKGGSPAGDGDKDKGRPKRGELVMNKLKEPVQKTNSLGVLGGYAGPTDEEVVRAKKETARSLRGTQVRIPLARC